MEPWQAQLVSYCGANFENSGEFLLFFLGFNLRPSHGCKSCSIVADMAAFSPQSYPRPDFERTKLRWQSLNGPWDFLFDDDDVGLSQRWQHHGIPGQVEVTGTQGSVSEAAKNITAKIAAGTQNLIQNNTFSASAKTQQKRTIQVPYVFQCPASGIHEKGVHEVLWYERKISDPRSDEAKSKHDKVLLRFGAVDYDATVWIDGQYVGGHRGGHVPFEIDITDALESTTSSKPSSDDPRRLTLRVYDSAYDLTQPRGKQYWGAQPESIFYTPSSGIWQNVWIEVVPAARLADSSRGTYLRSNDIESGNLHARVAVSGRRVGQKCNVELVSSFAGIKVATSESKELPLQTDHVNLDLSMRMTGGQTKDLPAAVAKDAPLEDPACWHHGVALWSPERPLLYDVSLRLLDTQSNVLDEVKTQVGMRSLNWTSDDSTFRLNGRPYFQALCLDQGYWADTFMTPPSADALKADVQLSKNMGFNGCRKHQKVEDPIFLYWADKLGYVVWGEMANAYEFGQEYIERYDQEWMEAVRLGINHPCILTWTPVNESWGYTDLKGNADHRNHIRSLYYMTK